MHRSYPKTILAMTLTSSIALVACGDDEGDTGADAGVTTDGGTTTLSLQEQAVASGQVDLIDGTGITVDANTLAVSGVSRTAPTTTLPSGMVAADYFGAVNPTSTTAWWQGWTAIDSDFDGNLPGADFHPLQAEIMAGTLAPASTNACATVNSAFTDGGSVTVFGASFPVCVISGDITTDTTLVNSHVFVLDGTVSVGDGGAMGATNPSSVTLTIPAGTQIYAAENMADGASLVATRGSKINAQGTAAMPIIMASVAYDSGSGVTGDPTDLSSRGLWGGLILSGMGETNKGSDVGSEASPPSNTRYFGGTNNADSSGSLEYVIIAETGFAFVADGEVQGLTIEAAGSGTKIDYIQIIGSDDDCVEWFGGAASASHLVCVGVNDDALDIDLGYVGNIQFVLVRIGANNGERGIESDNSGSNFDQTPVSKPNIANLTVLGNSGRANASTTGALHREGFAGKVYRSVFTDDTVAGAVFENGCLDIDDVVPADLGHYDSVFNCSGAMANGLARSDDD